jgi:CubicO group peptidase (beta-lactamase class C family)
MNKKNILPGSLFAAGVVALLRLAFTRVPSKKPASKPSSYAAIDAYVEEQRCRLHIPGITLAIVEGDRIVHKHGFGQARPGGEAPTPQTPFFIGSLTKSITATAVMQLVEAGKVELDAPVQRYLPWFCVAPWKGHVAPWKGRVTDPQASVLMTVRHLLNQTSGLSTIAGSIILADFDDRPDANERQVRALSTFKVSRPAGEKCEYSNLNYNILGLIVETASGETYAGYIQNHIFDPLEMRHSYSSKKEAGQNGLAVGHRHWFSMPFPAPDMPVPRGSLPSGQLISSAEDMAHYLIAHLNGGCYAEAQILSAAGIQELHRGAVDFTMMGVSAGRYGMGWFDIDLGHTKTYSHSGNVPEFSAFMVILPKQRKGFILLLNADPYGLPPVTEELGMGVTALLAGRQPASIRLDFIQWIMRLLPLIPILQIADVFATLRLLSIWRRDPQLRPNGGHAWGKHILPVLIPNLTLTAILVYLRSSGLLRFIQLFMPDLAWIARICGGFAGIWSFLRTGFILRALRK